MSNKKSVWLKPANFIEEFKIVNGSYYDYAADFCIFSERIMTEGIQQFLEQNWRQIKTNNGIIIFVKGRYIIRFHKCYPVTLNGKEV